MSDSQGYYARSDFPSRNSLWLLRMEQGTEERHGSPSATLSPGTQSPSLWVSSKHCTALKLLSCSALSWWLTCLQTSRVEAPGSRELSLVFSLLSLRYQQNPWNQKTPHPGCWASECRLPETCVRQDARSTEWGGKQGLPWLFVTQRGSSLLPRNPLRIWKEDSSLISFFNYWLTVNMDSPGGSDSKESACRVGDGFNPLVGKIPWRREWLSSPVFLPGKSHGQRSLVGHSPSVGHSWATNTFNS